MGVDILGPTFTTLLTLLLITWCGYQWKIGKWEAGPWWTDAARAHSSLATDTNSGILKMQPWPDAWHFLAPFHPGPKMIPPHLYWYQHTNMFLVQILMLQYFRLLWFWHWYCDEYTYYTLYHNIQSLLLGWKPPVAASSSNHRDIQLVVHLFSSQHTGSYTAQHYLKSKVCRRIWWQCVAGSWNIEISGISMDIPDIP